MPLRVLYVYREICGTDAKMTLHFIGNPLTIFGRYLHYVTQSNLFHKPFKPPCQDLFI